MVPVIQGYPVGTGTRRVWGKGIRHKIHPRIPPMDLKVPYTVPSGTTINSKEAGIRGIQRKE